MNPYRKIEDWIANRLEAVSERQQTLERLFNEDQQIAIDTLSDAIKAKSHYNEWRGIDGHTNIESVEAHRRTARYHRLAETLLTLQAERRIGECLIKNPVRRGRPQNVPTPDNNGLPEWLDRRDAARCRRLASIPARRWYEFLTHGLENEDLSRHRALEFVETFNIERHHHRIAVETERANQAFFAVPAKHNGLSRPRSSEMVLGYEKICRIERIDFRKLQLSEKPVAIITDPPYLDKYFDNGLWKDFAEWAQTALSKNGVLAAMVGTKWLDKAMLTFIQAGWSYRWTYSVGYRWNTPVRFQGVNPFWKPILVFQRPGERARGYIKVDAFLAGKRDKRFNPWQQDVETFERLVQDFTRPQELICDPFTGWGTTAVACVKNARRFVGSELAPKHHIIADREARAAFRLMQNNRRP